MILSSVSIKKPIMMTMVILAFVIFGIVSFTRLPIDLMPDVEFPFVTVQTIYIGAGPEDIETSVIKPLEEQLSTVNELKNITSFCMEGVGFILLEFNMGVDPDIAAIDVKDKVDQILLELPDDLQKPVVGKFDINDQPIVDLALTGPGTPEQLRRMAEDDVKERLLRIGGVATVELSGGREREIHVNLHKERLDALGLSVFQVFPVISSQSASIPAGRVTAGTKEYSVRVQGEFESLDEIRQLRIPLMTGGSVKVSSIADVVDSHKEIRELARFNGENSVGLAILKRPDANTVAVADQVNEELQRLNRSLPPGYRVQVSFDRSQFIEDAVNDTYSAMILGIILTAFVLLLFLLDWKLALIAAVSMPASIVVTFMAMEWFGFSLNIITLMALAISIGVLVANSIVVLENIVRRRATGERIREAADRGTAEVAVAVLASALTNIAVFFPLATMSGITGQIFRALGLTIVAATVVSLFLSFTLTPLMASRLLSARTAGGGSRRNSAENAFRSLETGYRSLLQGILHNKWAAIAAVLAAFLITLLVVGPRIGMEFFPQSDQGMINLDLEMPSGASLDYTDRALSEIEKRISQLPEVSSVYASVGGSGVESGVNLAQVQISLVDQSERTRSSSRVVNAIRPLLADIPDASIVITEVSMFGGGRGNADIEIEVTGAQMREILHIADSITAKAHQVPGLTDIRTSWKAAKPEIKFLPDRIRLDEYGTNVGQMGGELRFYLTGYDQAVYREGDDEYPIRVQYAPEDRESAEDIENTTVLTKRGGVPVKALAAIEYGAGAATIDRKNRQRLVTVMINVAEGTSGTKAAELKELTDQIPLLPGYKIYYGGQQEMMRESFGALIFAMLLAIVLTYMVLSGILESLLQPFVIMLTLPMGLIGVIWALFLTGNSISMLSLMSVIMLIGIVVNNAILIIDRAHVERREGKTPEEAILEAAQVKLKPILMMNIAIVLAMLPQALGLGSGAEIRAPFAITAIGGVIVSTVLTLTVIPALYVLTAKKQVEERPGQAT